MFETMDCQYIRIHMMCVRLWIANLLGYTVCETMDCQYIRIHMMCVRLWIANILGYT